MRAYYDVYDTDTRRYQQMCIQTECTLEENVCRNCQTRQFRADTDTLTP